MKVLLAGDSHGSERYVRNVCNFATTASVDTIVQLGDFGFRFEPSFLKAWKDWLNDSPDRKVYWLDGNHDNHDYIDEDITRVGTDEEVDMSAPIAHWHKRMFYCPRGSRTTFGESSVMFVGGAFSIDKMYRRPHTSWWEQEMITVKDLERAVEGGDVDVVFSHDCPNTVWFQSELESGYYKIDPDSQKNRDMLTAICDAVHPRHVYHGHYHTSYESEYPQYRLVHGLSDNTSHSDYAVGGENVEVVNF